LEKDFSLPLSFLSLFADTINLLASKFVGVMTPNRDEREKNVGEPSPSSILVGTFSYIKHYPPSTYETKSTHISNVENGHPKPNIFPSHQKKIPP
jgi:hypothetical protein